MRFLSSNRRVFLILCVSCSPVTAVAADEPSPTQFLVEFDYGHARLSGRDLDYAFVDPVGGLSGGGAIQRLDLGAHELPAFRLGYKLPGASPRWIEVRFDRWEGRQTADTGTHPGAVGALWASPDFAIGRSLVDRASAVATDRASSYSVRLTWRLGRETGPDLQLTAGLRAIRFEEESLVTYRAVRAEQRLQEVVSHHQDVRGWGPSVAVSWSDRFSRRVRVGATAEVALMAGRIDLDATDQSFIDGSFDRATIATRENQRRDLLVLGATLAVDVQLTRQLSAGLSYRFERWSGVSDRIQFVDDVSQNTASISEGRASFAGPSIRLRAEW